MIEEVTISNYKGIGSCDIKGLRRINLFIGKNDSGKSSILEAIFHTCKEFVGNNLNSIMRRRTNVFTGGRELWYGYDTNQPVFIELNFGDFSINLRLNKQVDRLVTTLGTSRIAVKGRPAWNARERGSEYTIGNLQLAREAPTHGINLLSKMLLRTPKIDVDVAQHFTDAVLIDCRKKTDLSTIESNLGKIKLDFKDVDFGKILESVYRKGRRWEFVPHPDSPAEKRIAFLEGQKRYFLSDFGDGFRFGVSICATAMTLRRTFICIEEIENHQHVGSLIPLIKNFVNICRDNELQLFITTHNSDVKTAFQLACENDKEGETKEYECFLVKREATTGKTAAKIVTDWDWAKVNREIGTP